MSAFDPPFVSYQEVLDTVTYVQDAEPQNPKPGQTWYDTDGGIYRVFADLGSGKKWHPLPPVQVLQEVSTFSESDITISNSQTNVNNQQIELATGTSVAKIGSGTSYNDNTNVKGVYVKPNKDIDVLAGTFGQEYNPNADTTAEVKRTSDNTVVATKDISGFSANETVYISVSLSAGTEYRFVGRSPSDFRGNAYGPSFPINSSLIDVTAGYYFGARSNTESGLWSYVGAEKDYKSGNSLISWDSGAPDDIESWDLASYQSNPDSETVSVDIEDGDGNVLYQDIGRNFDISLVNINADVQFRVNLERQDTSNNPTVNYLARRYVR